MQIAANLFSVDRFLRPTDSLGGSSIQQRYRLVPRPNTFRRDFVIVSRLSTVLYPCSNAVGVSKRCTN